MVRALENLRRPTCTFLHQTDAVIDLPQQLRHGGGKGTLVLAIEVAGPEGPHAIENRPKHAFR
jgi:hypothetical protein